MAAEPSPAMAAEPTATCRICMEDDLVSALVSPCACTGTQRWVHHACLKRWQETGGTARRAVCPVCREPYAAAFAPPPPPQRPRKKRSFGVTSILVAAAAMMLYATWDSLPTLERTLAMMLVGAGAMLQVAQQVMGIRFCLLIDEGGAPLLRLVRMGAPVDGLAAGSLLVATDEVGGGIFHRAAILLTEHGADGSVGFVLNVARTARERAGLEPDAADVDGAPLRHALAVPEGPEAVRHGVGGPVEAGDVFVLHRFGEVARAMPLGSGVFLGGDLPALRDRTRAAVREWRQRHGGGGGGGAAEERPPLMVQALQGKAAWAPGQLAGEVRAGVWSWGADGLGLDFALGAPAGRQAGGGGFDGPRWPGPPRHRDAVWEQATMACAAARRDREAADPGTA